MPHAAEAKKSFAKLLREYGFKGSAPTFRRFQGNDSVAVVNLQASGIRPGGTYINLGVQLRELDKASSWENIKEYGCAFRERLKDFAGGDTFFFDDEASMLALTEMLKLEGLPWIEKHEAKGTKKRAAAKKKAGTKKKSSVKRASAKPAKAAVKKKPLPKRTAAKKKR